MANYKIVTSSPMGGGKTSMTVTFIDQVNDKEDITCYHEIESTDDAIIAEQLSATATEYESRV